MRAFFRHPAVQRALSLCVSTYLKFVFVTLRWTREGQHHADGVWARKDETGAILAFWHAAIPLSPCTWERKRKPQDMRALISRSADGEFIAQTMEDLGFPAIRGSRRNPRATEDKGGAEAFRDMVRWLRDGGGVAITPDGPTGPAQVMGEGAPSLARVTGVPVLLAGLACEPCLRLKTWDRTIIPLPFARAAMVWDEPLFAPRAADPAELAHEWSARLNAATERAQALVAR